MPLRPAPSAVARRTMKQAYEDLDKALSPTDSRDFQRIDLAHVRKAATELEEQLAARQSLRNLRRLVPLLDGLERYSKAIEPLCSGTPYLQMLWAPITFILRTSSDYIEALEKIIKGYSDLASSLRAFQLLGGAFKGDATFQEALAVIYANVLEFHKYAYTYVHRSGWKMLFMSSWGRFGNRLNAIIEDTQRHRELIESQAMAINTFEAQRMRDDLRAWREEHLDRLRQAEQDSSARDFMDITAALNINEQDQLSVFHEASTEGEKHPGTCDWVIRNAKINAWLQKSPDTSLIWLQGSPGTGKSTIAARLVAFLKAAKMPVIHHFCTYLYTSSTQLDQILRSILLQLLRIDSDLVAHVYHLFVQQKKQPTIPTLEHFLLSLLEGLKKGGDGSGHIWIILDGVDECDRDKQSRLLGLMRRMTSRSSSWEHVTVKVLISSRPSHALTAGFQRHQSISLADEKGCLHAAIREYSLQRLAGVYSRLAQVGVTNNDLAELADAVAGRADGMFLYARLVLDYIAAKVYLSPEEVKQSVTALPDKVAEFYQQILTQILVRLDSQSVDRVRCVLGWVAFAKRPLKRLELLSAVSFSCSQGDVNHLAPQYLLDECASLVVERQDTTLAFIHVSVKEFLQGPSRGLSIGKEPALYEHCRASILCLMSGLKTYTQNLQEKERNFRLVKGIHGLHVYATEHWIEDLLSISVIPSNAGHDLLELANNLAQHLEHAYGTTELTAALELSLLDQDKRLKSLRAYTPLYRCVLNAVEANSPQGLDSRTIPDPSAANSRPGERSPTKRPEPEDGLMRLLASHQQAVRFLLDQHVVDGVSAEELKFFKEQFGSCAFTCRLRSCPRATLGFDTARERQSHEMAHARGFRCTVPGCQYLPFRSAQGLRNHLDDHHSSSQARKTIRRTGLPDLQGRGNWVKRDRSRLTHSPRNFSPHSKRMDDNPTPLSPPRHLAQDATPNYSPQPTPIQREGHTLRHSDLSHRHAEENGEAEVDNMAQKIRHRQEASPLLHLRPDRRQHGGIGRPPAGGPATPEINAPMPSPGPGQSPQVPNHPTPDHPRVMQDPRPPPQPGNALGDLNVERLPAHMKKSRDDWFVIFNPYVPRILDVDLLHTLLHDSVVCCVRFSADGKYVATGCNRSAQIFEVATGEKICVLQDESVVSIGDLYIRSVCFSPDGKYLATGGEDKLIRVWDIQSRQIRTQFSGHQQDIYSLDFARDGRTIASGSGDRTIRLWDIKTGSSLLTLTIEDGVGDVAISPDIKYVAAGSLDKSVRVWDIQNGYLVERLEGPDGHKDSVYSVAFSPNGKDLISGSLDKTIKMWELATPRGMPNQGPKGGRCVKTFEGHRDFVLSVALTPDAQWVISGSKDRGVQFWDPRTGSTQFMLQGHKSSVISVTPSPAGGYFATGSGDMRARIWSYNRLG